ncbi:unnamed protein product [Pieris macdunnoughi]|uniref:LRRNT domain-containing protein n=1 Tax=Pieris macdunnoughi TaxID=345717 RepID=A0A821LI65_9NEOP|nr:unnamed protein product [Pieris macdunnoughi]
MRPPTILKYLLLFNIFLLSLSECPQRCQCDRNAVRCLHQGLQAIPKTPQEAHTFNRNLGAIRYVLVFTAQSSEDGRTSMGITSICPDLN